MSSNIHRRQSKSSAAAKQAFEENENENKNRVSTRKLSYEHESLLTNPSSSNGHIDLDRFYERAFFTINDLTVEVILDNDLLSWSTVSGEISREEIHQRKSPNKENMNSISLHNVYAVSPIYNRWTWLLNNTTEDQSNMTVSNISADSQLRGFQLHTYERMEENILQEIFIIFQSNLPDQIEQWYQLLSKKIYEYKQSRNILVICNPYAGSRHNRHVYNIKIKPMLERAHYNITYLEINDLSSADDVFNDFQGDFDSLYGLVIIGGDGSVINVINALLRYLAKENRTRLDTENDLPPLPFPICIVPNGTTNIISHSIHGNTDHCTPILHLLFNQRMKIDMSAIFDVNYNFVTANFSSGAGYPANALKYFTRYSLFKPKKTIQKSFAKAVSNKNLKSVEVEIRYIPANQNSTPNTRCYQGCPSCTPTSIEQTDDQVRAFDDAHIQKVDKRKKTISSNNDPYNLLLLKKSFNQQNEIEKSWKILRHSYLQVAVLTNANLWSFAPQGLSKYGHLADGLLDLVLIKQTTRKEFLRYLERNGNSKDQYEFSFTNIIKVKEIEIELKLSNNNLINGIFNTNNQLNSSLSDDSSTEEQSSNIQKHEPHPPSAPMSEHSRRHRRHHQFNEQTQDNLQPVISPSKSMDPSILQSKNRNQQQKYSENEFDSPQIGLYSSNTSFHRKNIFQSLKLKKDKVPLPRPSSSCETQHIDEKQQRKNRQIASGSLRPARSFLSLLRGGKSSSGKQDSSSTTNKNSGRRSSVISQSSSIENTKTSTSVNNQYQNKKQPCMWNLDFTPYNSPLIRIKCFYRFLPVFGVGLNPDTIMTEVDYPCFGRIR